MNDIIKAVSILRQYGLKEIVLEDDCKYRFRLLDKVKEYYTNFSQPSVYVDNLEICGVKVKWEK